MSTQGSGWLTSALLFVSASLFTRILVISRRPRASVRIALPRNGCRRERLGPRDVNPKKIVGAFILCQRSSCGRASPRLVAQDLHAYHDFAVVSVYPQASENAPFIRPVCEYGSREPPLAVASDKRGLLNPCRIIVTIWGRTAILKRSSMTDNNNWIASCLFGDCEQAYGRSPHRRGALFSSKVLRETGFREQGNNRSTSFR